MKRVTVSPAPLRLSNKDMLEKLRLQIFGKKNITNAQIVRRVFRAYGFTKMWTNLNKNDRTVKIECAMGNLEYQLYRKAYATTLQLLQLSGVDITKVSDSTWIDPELDPHIKRKGCYGKYWISILIHVPFDAE